jgi:hypothetical protein
MLAMLILVSDFHQSSDTVMARAKRVAARLADTSVARAEGFGPLQVGRISDLTPFQGQHWLHRWWVFNGSPDLNSPSFVMFVPIAGGWQPAGLAYSRRLTRGAPVPQDLGGSAAPWHLHQPCAVIPGEGEALADGEEDCLARGGAPIQPEIAMVHAWTVPNPEGPYAHDNVALPFWITGVTQPRAADLSTPRRARRTRALGLALGESFGAIMPYARLVETASTNPKLADSLAVHRAAIGALVPRLKAADRSGDRAGWEAVADRMIGEWEALRRLYSGAAPSIEVKAQLDRQLARALGEQPGHHMH